MVKQTNSNERRIIMEINLLEKREDGYQAYCVILDPSEVEALRVVSIEKGLNIPLAVVLEMCIKVGMGL
jgi:hypothetical protein